MKFLMTLIGGAMGATLLMAWAPEATSAQRFVVALIIGALFAIRSLSEGRAPDDKARGKD